MTGILLYDNRKGRYVVEELVDGCIEDDSRVVDLHCGDTLKIRTTEAGWKETRIEMDSENEAFGWYFVGVGRAAPLIGHKAEIEI